MKKIILLSLSILLFTACSDIKNTAPSIDQSSPETLLKGQYEYIYTQQNFPVVDAGPAYQRMHKDEVLKTMEVVDKIDIPGQNITAVLYRFSIGSETVHESTYMKKINDKWYLYQKYFSSYDDDPFKNNDGTKGKEILKKIDDWTKETTNVWWN